jgi:hypothetical protein
VRETGIEAYVGSTVTFQIPAGSDTTIRSSLDTAGMKIVRGVDKNGECIVGAPFTLLPYVEHGVSKTHRKNKKTVHTQPFLVKKGLLKRLPPGTRMTMPGIRRV